MEESVYKVIELVGTSTKSWEDAATVAIQRASKHLREIRVARVVEQDIHIDAGQHYYRVKVELSFKYEGRFRPKSGQPQLMASTAICLSGHRVR